MEQTVNQTLKKHPPAIFIAHCTIRMRYCVPMSTVNYHPTTVNVCAQYKNHLDMPTGQILQYSSALLTLCCSVLYSLTLPPYQVTRSHHFPPDWAQYAFFVWKCAQIATPPPSAHALYEE